jgi:hypothetical protein
VTNSDDKMKPKKTIIFCLLFSLIGITVQLQAKKNSRIKLFASTGVSFPVYPGWFAGDRKPSANVGFGLELKLSPRLILRENFNMYSYYPIEDYYKSIWFGDTEIKLPEPGIYRGGQFFSSYDLWVDLKYIPMKTGRFSYYIAAGGGVCFLCYVSGGYVTIEGEGYYTEIALHALICGGMGVSYKVSGSIDLFLEIDYRYNFYKDHKKKRGAIPLRMGISTGI